MDDRYCKHAYIEGEGTTWYYACRLSGNPCEAHACMSCEDREAPDFGEEKGEENK